MIVNRRTFKVKLGRMQEALEILRNVAVEQTYRAYECTIGPFDTIAFELEFENLAEYEQFWSAFEQDPETPTFMERWWQVVDTGGVNEIWERVI